uniref:Uncharacterized protein n=1 Tax=Rhizophora mucronata TaxID=61149 RepID=A0A2P2N4L6_RHIMU
MSVSLLFGGSFRGWVMARYCQDSKPGLPSRVLATWETKNTLPK